MNIREDGTWLKPLPEYKNDFDKLRLGNYITIYSNMPRDENLYKVKAWPIRYLVEYVNLIKNFCPCLKSCKSAADMIEKLKTLTKNFCAVIWN